MGNLLFKNISNMKQGMGAAYAFWFGYAARHWNKETGTQDLIENKFVEYLSTFSKSYATTEEY